MRGLRPGRAACAPSDKHVGRVRARAQADATSTHAPTVVPHILPSHHSLRSSAPRLQRSTAPRPTPQCRRATIHACARQPRNTVSATAALKVRARRPTLQPRQVAASNKTPRRLRPIHVPRAHTQPIRIPAVLLRPCSSRRYRKHHPHAPARALDTCSRIPCSARRSSHFETSLLLLDPAQTTNFPTSRPQTRIRAHVPASACVCLYFVFNYPPNFPVPEHTQPVPQKSPSYSRFCPSPPFLPGQASSRRPRYTSRLPVVCRHC